MKKYTVEVNAYLNKTYYIEVEAEDEELARIHAADEVFGEIDPLDIDISITSGDYQ